jgi:hypothetical protein
MLRTSCSRQGRSTIVCSRTANQFESGATFADLGALLGFSALALALNPAHRVLTYDIVERIPDAGIPTAKRVANIEGGCRTVC